MPTPNPNMPSYFVPTPNPNRLSYLCGPKVGYTGGLLMTDCYQPKDVIVGGQRSDRYWFVGIRVRSRLKIAAGCHFLTLKDARAYWSMPPEAWEDVTDIVFDHTKREIKKKHDLRRKLNKESLLMVETIASLAKLRGWRIV